MERKTKEMGVIIGEFVYNLDFESESNKFDEYLPQAQTTMDSF